MSQSKVFLLLFLIFDFFFLSFVRHLRRPFKHLFEPRVSLPLVGTLYGELTPKNRTIVTAKMADAFFKSNPTVPRLYTEEVPVLGRMLSVADFKEGAALLKDMGSPNCLLARNLFVHSTYQSVFNQSLQNSWGSDWKWRRKALTPHFTGSKLQAPAIWDVIQEEVERLMARLEDACQEEKVSMLEIMSQYTLRVMLRIFFGTELNRDTRRVQKVLEAHANRFIQLLALPSFVSSRMSTEEYDKAHKEFFELAREEVRLAIAENRGIIGQV